MTVSNSRLEDFVSPSLPVEEGTAKGDPLVISLVGEKVYCTYRVLQLHDARRMCRLLFLFPREYFSFE